MRKSIKLLSCVAVVGFGCSLQAADTGGKWYLNVDAGAALQSDVAIKEVGPFTLPGDVKISWDTGFRVGLAGGYMINESLSVEVETGWVYNTADSVQMGGFDAGRLDRADLSMSQIPILVNGIYKFQLNSKFKPFIGGGVGGMATLLYSDTFDEDTSDFTFAYQGIAGCLYEISDKVSLGVTYKFLGTLDHTFDILHTDVKTDSTMTHCIMATVSFKF